MRILMALILVVIADWIDAYKEQTMGQYSVQWIQELHEKISRGETATRFNRTICEMNGGVKAYDEATEGSRDFFTCLSPLAEQAVVAIRNAPSQPSDLEAMRLLSKVACPLVPDAKLCYQNFVRLTKPCMPRNLYEESENVMIIAIPVIEFMCKDGGHWLTDFAVAGGDNCLSPTPQAADNCTRSRAMKDDSKSTTIKSPSSNSKPLNLHWISRYINNCLDLNHFQECLVAELAQCDDPATAGLMHSVLDVVKHVVSCDDNEI